MHRGRSTESIPKELEDLFWWVEWVRRNGAGGGSLTPLTRTKFIDAGTATTPAQATGSIGAPFSSISNWLTFLGAPATGTDAQNFQSGFISPGTYTENLTIPQYRNLWLMAYAPSQTVTGNLTWANGTGGSTPPVGESSALLVLNNILLNGNLTITDNGSLQEGLIFGNASAPYTAITGNIVATGATDLASVTVNNAVVIGNITSTANGTGATVIVENDGIVSGAIVSRNVQFLSGSNYNGSSITLASTGSGLFLGMNFTAATNPVISGAGATLSFDGPSWRSFREAGGTTSLVALIVGGYLGGDNPGANLTNANVSVALNGSGATAGFTGGGNHYTLPAATLGANHTVTLLTAGALVGDTILISRFDSTGNTYTVVDDAATTIAVMPANSKGFVLATFNGTHFVFTQAGGGVIT